MFSMYLRKRSFGKKCSQIAIHLKSYPNSCIHIYIFNISIKLTVKRKKEKLPMSRDVRSTLYQSNSDYKEYVQKKYFFWKINSLLFKNIIFFTAKKTAEEYIFPRTRLHEKF